MSWRLKILDPKQGETHSSSMPADRAIAFARDQLASSHRVKGMESSEREVLNEAEVAELCATSRAPSAA